VPVPHGVLVTDGHCGGVPEEGRAGWFAVDIPRAKPNLARIEPIERLVPQFAG